jgi:hypothetical protein
VCLSPSAEVIRKGKASKPTEFGKLIKLQEAENQIVIDYQFYEPRPSDTDLLIPAIDAHKRSRDGFHVWSPLTAAFTPPGTRLRRKPRA